MTACEAKEQTLSAVHNTAEGVALGSVGAYVGGLFVAAADILYNVANNAVNAAVTSGLGFAALAASVLTMHLTGRYR